jgi:C1A family cysteine protease
MFKVFAVALLGLALANAAVFKEEEYQFLFTKFMQQYEKKYSADQFFFRYTVFKANMDKIYLGNKQGKSYTLGMNEMGDMTHEEFKATKLGYRHIDRSFIRSKNLASKTPGAKGTPTCPAPTASVDSQDWVGAGAVTPIKNQGQCGSCWSFSTTGSVEGDVFIEAGVLTSLSEQQLVDCSTAQGNQGCNGGLMDDAFQYIISNGGLTTEAGYPYTATGPNTCNVQTPLASTITSYCDVSQGDESALVDAVAQQPVSVAIEADQSCFQFYSGGVMSDPSCGTQLDHGVLAVGFGVDGGQKYWNVKNSWGSSWGNNGYIMLGRQVDGQPSGVCGIALSPSFPYGGSSLGGKTADPKTTLKKHHRKH